MLNYITEAEYKELLGKDSIPDNFKRLVIEASEYINSRTFGRIDPDKVHDKVKYTTCLIIENLESKYSQENGKNLKSESVEGWSRTYATPEEIRFEIEQKNYEILREYLWDVIGKDGKPLLYVGVR